MFCEGSHAESAPFAEFMGYSWPWYSAPDSDPILVDGRGFSMLACYLRDDGRQVFETYRTGDRGVEALMTTYHALDLPVFGRQGRWENSPEHWPRIPHDVHPWRLHGRPTAQWSRTDEPA